MAKSRIEQIMTAEAAIHYKREHVWVAFIMGMFAGAATLLLLIGKGQDPCYFNELRTRCPIYGFVIAFKKVGE